MSAATFVLQLPDSWAPNLAAQPEAGMSYQVVTLLLNDGRLLDRVVVTGGAIDLSAFEAFAASPFSASDIASLEVTHDKSGPPAIRNSPHVVQPNESLDRTHDR
jgi:hypothetical protein